MLPNVLPCSRVEGNHFPHVLPCGIQLMGSALNWRVLPSWVASSHLDTSAQFTGCTLRDSFITALHCNHTEILGTNNHQ